MWRDACERKLSGYVQAGSWKPKYYGYTTYNEADVAWGFYLDKRIVPFSPADGGVSATPVTVPLVQPTTPQRNRNHFPNVQATASPHSPYNSPSPARHGSSTVASSPAHVHVLSSPVPLYSQLLPLSQRPSLNAEPQVEENVFFIVIIGYSPGVYISQ